MFRSARIKLTIYYLLIILLISGLFTTLVYRLSVREIDHLIQRVGISRRVQQNMPPPLNPEFASIPSVDELLAYKQRLQFSLLVINCLILLIAGGVGYFLAGKTLQPIQEMVNQQNQFITDASHELRTPLATMQAEHEAILLENKITSRKVHALVTSTLEEIAILKKMSNSLLILTQVEHQNNHEPLTKVSVTQLVNSAVARVKTQAKLKKITIKIQLPEIAIIGRQQTLIELIVILLDNALKYSSPKTLITISGSQTASHLQLIITDQGAGISTADLPHIFQRFYRADKSRSLTEGFGLGLAIAKKIVEAHRGTITAESKINQGTTVRVTLPLS
jgi:hypothetical protein